jgi:hypothetical protein
LKILLPLLLTAARMIVVFELRLSGLPIELFCPILVFVATNIPNVPSWVNIFHSSDLKPSLPVHNS